MWTEDQLKAIEAPVSDILVTAAAGSGKTAVMVERLIRRIVAEGGTDIDKMLVVTFTNAAAAEIKERIAAKIAEKLEEGDNQRLKNQLLLVSRASICTIHSYCLDIIRNNFHLLSLDPNFKVGDTAETALLRAKAMGDVLDKHYDMEDSDFLRVINSFTKKRDDAIEKIINDVYQFSQSSADPEGYLEGCVQVYSGSCSAQLEYILSSVRSDAQYCAELYTKALKLCRFDTAFEKCSELLSGELAFAEGIVKLCDQGWDRVYNFISNYKFSSLRSNKNMDVAVFEDIKALRERAKDCLKAIAAEKVTMPLATISEDLVYMQPCVAKICELVLEFSERYSEYKREKNIVDFNDIEHMALRLLTAPEYSEVAKAQKERFEEIYVDEYQDCNGVQEALFKAVSREGEGNPNMFMVGDMKQCIYRFRNANPQLFKYKSDTYAPYGQGSAYNKILLSKNFRSRAEVLGGVNMIFSRIMRESVGELDYNEEEYLNNGAQYSPVNEDTEYIDISIIDASGVPEDDEACEKPARMVAESNLVARKIRQLIDSGYMVYDKSADKYRPVKYRDIAILLRSVKGSGEYFGDALSELGIPSFCDTGVGYFDCEEVATLISFIKIISNPLDDISLVSIMRSPIYDFSDNELLKIRTADRTGYYYNAVLKYSELSDGLSGKVKAFLKDIDSYRRSASVMGVDELLWYLCNETGYMEYIGTLQGAAFKKANIRALINRARIFTADHGGDVAGFADFVDEISLSGGDGQGAKLIGENDDVVRIMTIHKSKGLEFPVVFVSRCGNKFNTRDLSEPVLMHHELGLGIDYVDEKKRFAYKMTVREAIKEKILEENLSEEMRLMYVALTRAREKLFITGVADNYSRFIKDIRFNCGDAGDRLNPRLVSSAKTYLGWICQAVYGDTDADCVEACGGGIFRREVVPIYSLADQKNESAEDKRALPEASEHSPYKSEILRRLTYQYPHEGLTRLPRNVTVTEIKRLSEIEDADTYRLYRMPALRLPDFAKDTGKIDAAALGTLMHFCMQKIRLTYGQNKDTIKEEIRALAAEGFITEQEADAIDPSPIAGFFSSPLGVAMTEAAEVHREVPFEILVEADEIFPRAGTDEKIVVQGMIDAYFADNDGNLILVDYKTDRCKGADREEFKVEIVRRYRLQIHYYEKALQLLTGRSVRKKYIYLFDIGEAVEI